MGDYIDADVRCPFYLAKQGDRYRIKCEGPVKNVSTQLTFRGEKQWYIKDFCCRNYTRCRVYQMLQTKYTTKKAEGD